MQDFEFDKIMWALAIGVAAIILASNIGNMLYIPVTELLSRGYKIEIKDNTINLADLNQGLPDELDMSLIMSSADAEAGKQVFKKCAVCHSGEKGGPNKVGPNLWNILNSQVANNESFNYSAAMQQKGAADDKWGYEALYRYLYSPREYVPGNKMAFGGIKDDNDRANLIAYLRTLSDSPAKLP